MGGRTPRHAGEHHHVKRVRVVVGEESPTRLSSFLAFRLPSPGPFVKPGNDSHRRVGEGDIAQPVPEPQPGKSGERFLKSQRLVCASAWHTQAGFDGSPRKELSSGKGPIVEAPLPFRLQENR